MLDNKVIAIIGGSGLIGKSFIDACINNNAKVIVGDKVVNSKLFERNKNILYKKIDITKENSIIKFLDFGLSKFGKIHSIVNCAYPKSKGFGKKIEEIDPHYLKEDLFAQLGGAIILSKVAINFFNRNKGGNIINISSIQGISSPKFDHYKGTKLVSPIEYSAVKAGIISITRYLAKYCSNKNIRVNCISPGGIRNGQPAKFMSAYKKNCSSKGMLDANDLNGALIFLLSDSSKYINGQNIIIDDGWSL